MRVDGEIWPDPDPGKSNHYADDILGDPYTCIDSDHNHPPEPEIERELRWRRRNARPERFAEFAARLVIGGVVALFFLGVYTLADAVF